MPASISRWYSSTVNLRVPASSGKIVLGGVVVGVMTVFPPTASMLPTPNEKAQPNTAGLCATQQTGSHADAHVLVVEDALHQHAVDVGRTLHDALRLLHLHERLGLPRRLLPLHRRRVTHLA